MGHTHFKISLQLKYNKKEMYFLENVIQKT